MLLSFVMAGCERDGPPGDRNRVPPTSDTSGFPVLDTLGTLSRQDGTGAPAAPGREGRGIDAGENRRAGTGERADDVPPPASGTRDDRTAGSGADGRQTEADRRSGTILSGTYVLVSVQGRPLPATIFEGESCVLEIPAGRVALSGDSFVLETQTRENCDGRVEDEKTHRTTGTVRRDGSMIRFDGGVDDAMGYARGRLDGERLTITELGTEGGVQNVAWIFETR